jgi:hypothetical protein
VKSLRIVCIPAGVLLPLVQVHFMVPAPLYLVEVSITPEEGLPSNHPREEKLRSSKSSVNRVSAGDGPPTGSVLHSPG